MLMVSIRIMGMRVLHRLMAMLVRVPHVGGDGKRVSMLMMFIVLMLMRMFKWHVFVCVFVPFSNM